MGDEEQIELKEQHRKEAEQEQLKQEELAAKGAYDVAPDEELDAFDDGDDDEKGNASNKMKFGLMKAAQNFRARQEAQAKAQQGDQHAQQEFEELEKQRLARRKQNALMNDDKYKNKQKSKNNQNNSQQKKAVNKQWKTEEQI